MPRFDGRKDSTQDQIAEAWRACGFWVLDLHNAAGTFAFEHEGERVHGGIADLLALRGELAIWIECKAKEGRLEPAERAFQMECEAWGCPYLIEACVEQALQEAQQWRNRSIGRRGG